MEISEIECRECGQPGRPSFAHTSFLKAAPWTRSPTLGQGGFGQVYAFDWHGTAAAYKIVRLHASLPGQLEAEKESKKDEYRFQLKCATKPTSKRELIEYEKHCPRGEELILKPLGYFFMRDCRNQNEYFVIVTPQCYSDLEHFKQQHNDKLTPEVTASLMEQCHRMFIYLYMVKSVRHQDIKPRNILVDQFYPEKKRAKSNRTKQQLDIKLKLTDFGLSGDFSGCEKRGGSPIFGAPEVFGSDARRDHMIDEFSLARVCLFLALDRAAFNQLLFMPIEDSVELRSIRKCLDKSKFLHDAKNMMRPVERFYTALHQIEKVKLNRHDLINLGIRADWFLDERQKKLRRTNGRNRCKQQQQKRLGTIESENWNLNRLDSFAAFDYSRSSMWTGTYHADNSNLSARVHSQGQCGDSAYQCWAFSCTTMLRHSWRFFLRHLLDEELITNKEYKEEYAYVNSNDVFKEIKNLLMLMIVPKKMHIGDTSQAAYLKAAISRLCHKTALDEEGLYYLRPLFGTRDLASTTMDASTYGSQVQCRVKFNLTLDQVRPSYNVFYNPFSHQSRPKLGQRSILEVVKVIDENGTGQACQYDELCPVGAVNMPGETVTHAMVLDAIRIDSNGQHWFQFKNTTRHNSKVEILANDHDAPTTFYYIHINLAKKDG